MTSDVDPSTEAPEQTTPGPAATTGAATEVIDSGINRQTIVLLVGTIVALAWSVLFWMQTDATGIALGALICANFIGCCLLLSLRNRS